MPIQAAIIYMAFCLAAGYGLCLLVARIRLMQKEFDAYSDKELSKKRQDSAMMVRSYAQNHRSLLPDELRLMKRIDREIERRKTGTDERVGQYALEAKKAKFDRDITEFDLVYEEVLNSVRQPTRRH